LGQADDVIGLDPAAVDEEFGTNLQVEAINDDILAALDGSRYKLPALTRGWGKGPLLDEFRNWATLALDGFPGEGPCILSDPAIMATLEFWQSIAPALRCVLVVRNPIGVARSMVAWKRSRLTYALGMELWLRSHELWLRALDVDPCLVVHYESLCERPLDELRRISEYLNLSLDDAALQMGAALADPPSFEFPPEQAQEIFPIPDRVWNIYEQLCDRCGSVYAEIRSQKAADVRTVPEAEAAYLRETIDIFGEGDSRRMEATRYLEVEISVHKTEIAELKKEIATAELKLHISRLEREVLEREHEGVVATAQHDLAQVQRDLLAAQLDAAQQTMRQDLLVEQERARVAEAERERLAAELDALRHSFSFRVTAPLRAVRSLFNR
jgi:hypothetical protein